jgi:hypothetical protein
MTTHGRASVATELWKPEMFRIAWKLLAGDRAKYAGLIFGIAFTSFLVTFAASYFCGFMTRGFALIAENPGVDVWVMNPAVESVVQTINVPLSALEDDHTYQGRLFWPSDFRDEALSQPPRPQRPAPRRGGHRGSRGRDARCCGGGG